MANLSKQVAVQLIDALEKAGHYALAPGSAGAVPIHENDRRMIEQALKELRPAFDELARLTDPAGYDAIHHITMASFCIGVGAAFTDSAKRLAQKAHVSIPQTANREQAAARKAGMKDAILQAAGKRNLKASIKFAETIKKEVCQILGVKLGTRGYSSSTIQKEICAILKERSKK